MPKISRFSPPRSVRFRSAFSLIELIIVILIASLVTGLVFSNVSLGKSKEKKVGIRALKEAAASHPGGDADLVCVNACKDCALLVDHKAHSIGSQLKPLTAYILDDSNSPQEIDFGRRDDKKVCLRSHYYANGSTSQMILQSQDHYYFVPSYFGKTERFDSLSAATERWLQYRSQLDTMGTYF